MNVRLRRRVSRLAQEFLIILVGVLAALSVDSWRQNRLDRARERQYLEQVGVDSRENLRLIGEAIELEARHMRVAQLLWQAGQLPTAPSADSVGAWLERRDGSWWYSDPRLRDGTISALAQTGDFALVRDTGVRSAILGYVSQLHADLEEFRRHVQLQLEAETSLDIRGEVGSALHEPSGLPPDVRAYMAILADPQGRAALARLLHAYENRIWYLQQMEAATAELEKLLN